MEKIGFFAGSFDPFTKGHLHVVKISAQLFEKVIIGIGILLFMVFTYLGVLLFDACNLYKACSLNWQKRPQKQLQYRQDQKMRQY